MQNVNTPNKKNAPKKKRRFPLTFLYILAGVLLVATVLFSLYIAEGLPSLEELESPRSQLASNVWSVDGQLIGQFFRQNRVEASIDSIPQHVINALIATEDKNFYDHWGVDVQRFIKAMIKNVFLFKREGASTITQQLAKNLYELKRKRESSFDTIVRKVREWVTAIQIEKNYTKKEILEMYLNISWFGRGAYGIQMASKIYFDKNVNELSVLDAGILISLLKSAVIYDPYNRYENAFRRRNLVIDNMVASEFLNEEEASRLKQEPIKVSYKRFEQGFTGTIAPHFLEYVRQQMEKISDKYGSDLYEDGLNIYTTLDSRMQKIANDAVTLHINPYQIQFDKSWSWKNNSSLLNELVDRAIRAKKEYKDSQSEEEKRSIYSRFLKNQQFVDSIGNVAKRIEVGFVALDVKTGEIRAMVGGKNQKFLYGLNHATQIKRQPGSAFKPIVYATAIDNGLYPAFPILNQRINHNGWSPENFDRETSGFTTLRQALSKSLNLISARLIVEGHAPLWKIGNIAERLGIKSKLDLVPAISLGTSEVSPLELTSAFSTIAHHGIYNEPISIMRIEDKDGGLIERFSSYASEAISEETAYITADMMRSVIDNGTAHSARSIYKFQRPAGGKTGTTQAYADTWFVGFTPQICAGVWVGFDDHRVKFTGALGQGARAALPIWAIFMHDVYQKLNLPVEDFSPPSSGNVVPVKFCRESIFENGEPKLYSSDCRGGVIVDIANIKDIPELYNSYRDSSFKFFDRYGFRDSLSREAKEIR